MPANDDDGFGGLSDGQKAFVVFQQNNGFFRICLCHLGMTGIVDRRGHITLDRIIDQTMVEHGIEDAMRHVVEARLGHVTVIDSFF